MSYVPPIIHFFQTASSTNILAFEIAGSGGGHGEVVQAVSQSAGRGRLGKSWQSPPGKGLYFSIIVRPRLTPENYPKLTMTAGLAVARVVEAIYGCKTLLKWPNDIFLSEKKCGGILCEASLASPRSEERFAVIGIGLNVLTEKTDFPEELQGTATSLLLETGVRSAMDELLGRIHKEVLERISQLDNEGFSDILAQWKRRDFLKSRWLEWVSHSHEIVTARSEGPDENGQLLVRDKKGVLHRVLSGDIRLAEQHKKKGSRP
jgi:BirA family biotin operon repressor/biotin-[acetyl-CoA-carboxylase] ligase